MLVFQVPAPSVVVCAVAFVAPVEVSGEDSVEDFAEVTPAQLAVGTSAKICMLPIPVLIRLAQVAR